MPVWMLRAEGLECELIDEVTMQLSGADQTVRFETIEANGGRTVLAPETIPCKLNQLRHSSRVIH
jgi:hypothetical protein